VPFTVSHAAAALPLRRWGLPLSALVAGCMAPDLTYYVPGLDWSAATHTLAGAASIGAVLGVLMFAGWHALVSPLLLDQAPASLRGRLAATGAAPLRLSTLTRADWARAWLAAALGALTHAAWDSFTHPHGAAAERLPFLQREYLAVPGSSWAQHASTVIGGAIVVLALVRWYRRTEPVQVPAVRPRISRGLIASLLIALPMAGAVSAGAWVVITLGYDPLTWRTAAAVSAIKGGTVLLVMLLITGLVDAGTARHDSMGP
jgi:hypothetical protein